MKDDQIPANGQAKGDPAPEPHEPPVLIELGSYVELTRGGNDGPTPDAIEVGIS